MRKRQLTTALLQIPPARHRGLGAGPSPFTGAATDVRTVPGLLKRRPFACVHRKDNLFASSKRIVDSAHDVQLTVLVADWVDVIDMPFGIPSRRYIPCRVSNRLLLRVLTAATIVFDRRAGRGIGGDADRKADGGIAGGDAGNTTRNDSGDLRHRRASREKYHTGQDEASPLHCNAPQRAVAGSAVAHFQVLPSRQTVAV